MEQEPDKITQGPASLDLPPLLEADGAWDAGAPVPFLALARAFDDIEELDGRLDKTARFATLLRHVMRLTPEDLVPVLYLAASKVAPDYMGDDATQLQIGDAILMKAVAEGSGRTLAAVKKEFKKKGDLGTVAQAARSKQNRLSFGIKPKTLTARGVLATFRKISAMKGNQVQAKKANLIKAMFVAARGSEPVFIVRGLQGKMRIGLAFSSVQVALADAVMLTPLAAAVTSKGKGKGKSDVVGGRVANACALMARGEFETWVTGTRGESTVLLKRVYNEYPNLDDISAHLLAHGFAGLHEAVHAVPGIPIKPMLAQRPKGLENVVERFDGAPFTCEYKYDGERCQVHRLADGSVRVYTRSSGDVTAKYPDMAARLPTQLKEGCTDFIVDGEVVAWDPATEKILPFQQLSHRGRKDVKADDVSVEVCLFLFDVLYINGASIMDDHTLEQRRGVMREWFIETKGQLQYTTFLNCDNIEDMQAFLNVAVAAQTEGLIVKSLRERSGYLPGERSFNWLKVKKDYLKSMQDSVDLVPIAAWFGKGKRTGGYGAFLLACWDEDSEQFQTCCKIGTGFSEENLKEFHARLSQHTLDGKRSWYDVTDTFKPDVWLDATETWEVRAADLSISPAHTGAMDRVKAGKGIALRFPRFLRVRDDKAPQQCTSSVEIGELYQAQASVA